MATTPQPTLFCLPNELLLRSLSTFCTRELVPLTRVSYRFHDLVLRILHSRLLSAARMTHHKLILECYHPASKNIDPYLFCDYLGTPGLSSEGAGTGFAYHSEQNIGRMGKLGALYSRFRPIRLEEEDRLFAPVQMPGDLTVGSKERSVSPLAQMLSFSSTSSSSSISASASASAPSSAASFTEEAVGPRLVKHKIHLDVDEPFSQLCVVTNLARLGQSRGVFFNSAGVADGVVRAKRNWLAKRAATATEGRVGDGDDDDGEDRILWLNHDQVVGLKVKVDERTCARAAPVLMLRDEDPAIIYNIQYEELLVRTVRLLLAVEEALLQDYSSGSSKTMIFGSFVRPN